MFEPSSSGAVTESTAAAGAALARQTRSSRGHKPAEAPLPFAPLKHNFAWTFHNDKCTRPNPARPRTVWSLYKRSEGEVNLFLRLWSKPERQRHPAQFSQPFSLHSFKKGEKCRRDRSPEPGLNEQFSATYCETGRGVCVSPCCQGSPALLRRGRWGASALLMVFAAHS